MTFSPLRQRALSSGIVLILIFVVLPLVLEPFRLNLVGKYLSFAFVAIGIVLTWGYGGVLSLGQGIFFGMGGYMMAMFLKLEASAPDLPDFMVWSSVEKLPLSWEPFHRLTLTILLILTLPTILAYLFSYVVFKKRVGGVYFAIVTLALALAATVWIIGQQGYTGGANGITNFKTLLGMDVTSPSSQKVLYFVQAAALAFVMFFALALLQTRFGKVLLAIRDSEDRVRFSGYNTATIKAFTFAVAALLSAIGGAFYTLQVGIIAPGLVGVVASIEMVIYAAVGGRLSVPGAVVGALLVGFLKSYLSETFPEIWLYFLGGLFILIVVAMPYGLAGLGESLVRRRFSAVARDAK